MKTKFYHLEKNLDYKIHDFLQQDETELLAFEHLNYLKNWMSFLYVILRILVGLQNVFQINKMYRV